jgi:peptidoglycan/xylan/chitin deacetylase (PgdA/CDA1 family)
MEIFGTFALLLGICAYLTMYNKTTWFGKQIWRVKTTQKIVALTFDDGPNEPYTSHIVALLKTYEQNATFFVVGKNMERFPGVTAKTQADGHEIGIHSYAHQFRSYFSDPTYKEQIALAQKGLISEHIEVTHLRFPWLFRTPWLVSSSKKHGFGVPIGGYFGGLFEPFQPKGEWMAKHAKKLIKPGAIIIMHDGYNASAANRAQTVIATELLLKELAEKGYRSVTISQLLALKD